MALAASAAVDALTFVPLVGAAVYGIRALRGARRAGRIYDPTKAIANHAERMHFRSRARTLLISSYGLRGVAIGAGTSAGVISLGAAPAPAFSPAGLGVAVAEVLIPFVGTMNSARRYLECKG